MSLKDDPLWKDLMNCTFKFGLESQGHIPTIEKMLDENKEWDDIAKEIGWCKETAMEWYIRHLREQRDGKSDD